MHISHPFLRISTDHRDQYTYVTQILVNEFEFDIRMHVRQKIARNSNCIYSHAHGMFVAFFLRGFKKGLAGGGWRQQTPKTAQKVLQKCVPLLLKGGIGKGYRKRGLNLWHMKDLLAPTPSVRQALFETSDFRLLINKKHRPREMSYLC